MPCSYLDELNAMGMSLTAKDLIPEALSPAFDPGEALPVIGKRGGNESNSNQFRFQGFGKYRKDHFNKQDRDDDDSDGIYHDNIDGNGTETRCKHRTIVDCQCQYCPYKMTRFGSFFDSGAIPQYLRVLQASDSENSIAQLGKDVDMIYENYSPTNIIQLRDHMQTMIGRSLVSNIKKQDAGEHDYRVLPSEALYSDLLEHVKNYERYRKDFKEQKANVMKSNALFIDSYFESGNIEKVFKNRNSESQEYHLFIDEDTNTRGHQQWFYFRVRNMHKDTQYKFNIWNFTKPKSLYKEGMKPMWRSKKREKYLKIDDEFESWDYIPKDNISEVKYFRSNMQRQQEQKGLFEGLFDEEAKNNSQQQYVKKFKDISYYYCLSFNLTFTYNKDSVYIAYSRPFKFTRIITEILKLEGILMGLDREKYSDDKRNETANWDGKQEIEVRDIKYSRKLMCLTNSGLPVPILTITAGKATAKKRREGIVISSRVHPGETNSSFVFQGILEMLMSYTDPIASSLRESFVFKLIPCLNPDGVVVGNYRSSFAGVDLNRQWILPSETLHPTIFHTKKELEKLHKERSILLYCDLHGHSRKRNSFIYGCNRAANGGFNSWTKVRLLPRILASKSHVFDINSCKFKVEKGKMGTARVVVWKDYEVTNSFTLENSFHGFDYGESFKEFGVDDFKELGQHIMNSVYQYQIILIEIQKELNITRGWLKPKRLLEITGQTAQEKLRQEDKDRKMAKKSRSQAIGDEVVVVVHKQAPKPPRMPVQSIVKSRGGPSITLQGLIDEFVKKQENKNEETANIEVTKKQASSKTLNSRTLQKEKSPVKPVEGPSKEEKFVQSSIVKIQSFFRMMISRTKYVEQQAKKAEEELQEEDSPIMPKARPPQLNIPRHPGNRLQVKYMNQLTLEMIESEGMQQQQKPSTADPVGRFKTLESTEEVESTYEIRTIEREQEDEGPKEDWRQFFTVEELTTAFEKIQKGQDPNEEEVPDEEGSDSAPSEGNLDLQELYGVIYCDSKKKKEKLEAKDTAEQNYEKEFANFVKKLHKRKRDASKDSGGSVEPSLRDKKLTISRNKISPRIRLASSEKKDDVKLAVAGRTIDNGEEEKKSTSKKKRIIIGGIKKGASIAASSPEGSKKGAAPRQQQQISSNSVNLKNRRLRSQENKEGITNTLKTNADHLKPALSNAEVVKIKPEQITRAITGPINSADKTHRITGIQNNQKRSFLPILSNKLSQGVTPPEEPASVELRSEMQVSDTISPASIVPPSSNDINPSMQQTLTSNQFSAYDSFNGSKGMQKLPSQQKMAETAYGQASMMQLGLPINGGNRQSVSYLASTDLNQPQQFQKSQQNFNVNLGLTPGQQANQINQFHESYRLLNNDQLNVKVEPKGGRSSHFRSPQHQSSKRSPFGGPQEYQTTPAIMQPQSYSKQSKSPGPQGNINFGQSTGGLLNQNHQKQQIGAPVDSRTLMTQAQMKSPNPPRRNILRVAQQSFGLQSLNPQHVPSIMTTNQIASDNQNENQNLQAMMNLIRSPGQMKFNGNAAAKKVNYKSPIGRATYSDAIGQEDINRIATRDEDDFETQQSVHITNENKQRMRSPGNGGTVMSFGQSSQATNKKVPNAHISIPGMQNNMHSPARVVNGQVIRGQNYVSPSSQLQGTTNTRYLTGSSKKLGPSQGMPSIRLKQNQISPQPPIGRN